MNAAKRSEKAAADAELVEAKKELADALKKQDEHHKHLSETNAANVRQAEVDQTATKLAEALEALAMAPEAEKEAAAMMVVPAVKAYVAAEKARRDYFAQQSAKVCRSESATRYLVMNPCEPGRVSRLVTRLVCAKELRSARQGPYTSRPPRGPDNRRTRSSYARSRRRGR